MAFTNMNIDTLKEKCQKSAIPKPDSSGTIGVNHELALTVDSHTATVLMSLQPVVILLGEDFNLDWYNYHSTICGKYV
jgi:hypothetical protein